MASPPSTARSMSAMTSPGLDETLVLAALVPDTKAPPMPRPHGKAHGIPATPTAFAKDHIVPVLSVGEPFTRPLHLPVKAAAPIVHTTEVEGSYCQMAWEPILAVVFGSKVLLWPQGVIMHRGLVFP